MARRDAIQSLLTFARLDFSLFALYSSTVKSGNDAESFVGLLGLNSVAGAIGLGCQQIPINVIVSLLEEIVL